MIPDFYLYPYFWAMGGLFLLHWVVYLGLFRRFLTHKPSCETQAGGEGISVLVAARNEVDRLKEYLPSLLYQDHPNFEVIVVDDQSWDKTPALLAALSEQFPHLKVVSIGEHIHEFKGKKLAITLGIKAAANDIIILTDADCKPQKADWLRLMHSAYKDGDTQFVLGYSPYAYHPGLLNLIIRYETVFTGLMYMSAALRGKPYMGVGRNLSYRKNLFLKKKGFAPYLHLPSGDDDLFVNLHATKGNTQVQLCPDSFVLSEPKHTWGGWLRQKRRHLFVGKFYKGRDKRMLTLVWLIPTIFYLGYAGLALFPQLWAGTCGLLLLHFILLCVFFANVSGKLRAGKLWIAAPLLHIWQHLLYQPFVGLLALRTKKLRHW